MFVEILDARFQNKGAYLMILTIIKKVKSTIPKIKIVMKIDAEDYEERAKLGMYQIVPNLVKNIIPLGFLIRSLPNNFKKALGIVEEEKIDVALDASGFYFSDQWGEKPTRYKAKLYRRYRKQNKRIILLPQAFGPFTSNSIRENMGRVIEYCDLIYARDRISYKYLMDVSNERQRNKIKICPDFTNDLAGIVPDYFKIKDKMIAIIPNNRMLDKTSSEQGKIYLDELEEIIVSLLNQNYELFFLIFGGSEDYNLAKSINEKLKLKLNIVKEENPIFLKGIIGQCTATVTSRFHALSCALSQGIPSLVIGWSHKYSEMLKDYGVEECLIESTIDGKIDLLDKINLIIDDNKRNRLIGKIKNNCDVIEQKIDIMWQEIFELINR